MVAGPVAERNQDATVYVGGLDEKVTEAVLWELFLQAGPVVNVHMPKDRVTQTHQGYGFVEFMGEEDADYAIKIMNMIKMYGKPIRVNKASANQRNLDVGANIFIGNLDPEVDEKLLYDTFSAFGIMRDPDSGNSKGYAFINFASFEAADSAIEAMNGQYLCNRAITISYAFRKDSKGERHGSAAERMMAAKNPLSLTDRPHQLFADAPPPSAPAPGGVAPPPPPPSQQMPMPGMPSSQPSSLPPPVPPPMGAPGMGMPPPPAPPMSSAGPNQQMAPNPTYNQSVMPNMPPPPGMRPPPPNWRGPPPRGPPHPPFGVKKVLEQCLFI
ncbi:SF3B4-like protein [Mya arenaria]|uniref:SF3B4-like protein n=1 Tax=Mya arenaria TaxID=6604 RepID=A0ABY7F2E6_MYAAR|nr:SF3B4-like protein [Mya arenaria]